MTITSPWHRLGLRVGHATDPDGVTGCTVILGRDAPFRCASAILGRASGSRELDTTAATHFAELADAILLTGGSAYGLDAAAGVMAWCESHGRGVPVPGGVVPIVPAAVIFDLAPLGRFDARPTPTMTRAACEAAAASNGEVTEGSVGVGTGATIGKARGVAHAMKGGVGVADATRGDDTVAALAVVNAFGDVRDAHGAIIAGARRDGRAGRTPDDFADTARLLREASESAAPPPLGTNTTLAVVATSVPLDRTALGALARAATTALQQRITPVGTPFDGDVVFATAPPTPPVVLSAQAQASLEALAVDVLARAIERAVRLARGTAGLPGLADHD